MSYKNETSSIAPIEVEILFYPPRRIKKIETDSGTSGLLKTKISAPEKNLKSQNLKKNFEPLQL